MTVKATVVQDSISPTGKRIITLNLSYGLIIHAEFLRHRLFSDSVASQRAIPMKHIRKQVLKNPYVPVWFGAQQKGMVADEEVKSKGLAKWLWKTARYPACGFHWIAEKCGAHKEWSNRLLNPWQYVQQTVTFTEIDNFLELRLHKDAQKDIQVVAQAMKDAIDASTPLTITTGQWHLPYINREFDEQGNLIYYDNDGSRLTREQAIEASVARVARSSYNNHDKSTANWQNDKKLYDFLITSKPAHASPAEAQATPMSVDHVDRFTIDNMNKAFGIKNGFHSGATHVDKLGRVWSGNLMGWVQFRQTLGGFEDKQGVK